jgi:hypothetical protein
MKGRKFLSVVLFSFSFVVLANCLAFAERDCTRQVSYSNGTKDISVDCSSSYTQNANSFWGSLYWSIQNMRDRFSQIFSLQDRSKQVTADMKEKEQDAREIQQSKHQDQESQAEDLKDRQEMEKQQQQDLMQNLKDKK